MILMDRLGPDIFSTLRVKGHVLHRVRAFKSSGLITSLECTSDQEVICAFVAFE